MARITQKANKSPVSKWSATSPKPKVVPTSNGEKVKAPVVEVKAPVVVYTVQRDEQLKHFAWLYPIWLDSDGPIGIDGTDLEVEDFEDHEAALDYFVSTEVLYRTDVDELFEWADFDNIRDWLMSHMSDDELRQFCADHDDESMVEEIRHEKGWEEEEDEESSSDEEEEEEFDVVAATTTVYNQYQVTDSDRQRIEARVQQRLNMLNGGTGGTVEEYLAHAAAHGANHGDTNSQDQPN